MAPGPDLALGTPAQTAPNVRQFERDISASTYTDPYSGSPAHVVSYAADQAELGALNMVTADPLRTPTLVVFSPPDDFINSVPAANAVQSSAATSLNEPTANFSNGCSAIPGDPSSCTQSSYVYVHGDFAPQTNDTWAGLVGPGSSSIWGPTAGCGRTMSTSRPRCSTSWACTSPTLPTAVLSAR